MGQGKTVKYLKYITVNNVMFQAKSPSTATSVTSPLLEGTLCRPM